MLPGKQGRPKVTGFDSPLERLAGIACGPPVIFPLLIILIISI